ncbi:hypothetical protein CURE108131_21440 [Cupriavidus respiraculi]|uniref:Uncharacterized protein n=1 Tax=Cupriavidus respiraculi TaxID=195930 RepID=A0ABN7YMA2_9BURK|nr:hypothetical protein [Cupriavidus respiraculi]MBY4945973.1 hypothetical protein [Cupriavidus respiraculi]CAG9174602.1 hypothetical protein LMG21510_02646 [Cupriavidus respiraculi]
MPAGRAARPPKLAATALSAAAISAALLWGATALAQPVRAIPADAPRAELVLATPTAAAPQTAMLDGKPFGVAPGLRLFGPDNQLLSTVAVAQRKLAVRYKLDLYGQLLTAWVLSEQEQKATPAR